MSKIREELVAAVDLASKRGEEPATFRERLFFAVQDGLSDAEWDKLSAAAQDYINAVGDAIKKKTETPDFPDLPKSEPAATGRRRAPPPDDEPVAFTPTVGCKVILITTRDKEYAGEVLELLDGGGLALSTASGDFDFDADKIKSVASAEPAEPAATGRRRAPPPDDEPAEPAPPGIGDTVEVTNSRGTITVGLVEELKGDDLALKTAAGDIVDFTISKLKDFKVKVRAAGATTSTRTRAAAAEPAAEGKQTRSTNAGVSVGMRIREIVLDNLGWTKEQVGEQLKKEKLEFKDNTVGLNFAEIHKTIEMMKARKMLK